MQKFALYFFILICFYPANSPVNVKNVYRLFVVVVVVVVVVER